MPIKLIAVDMDGTFLDSRKKFNKERFAALYKRMLEKDIRFVVASGNQYYQLRSFFPEIQDEYCFCGGKWRFRRGLQQGAVRRRDDAGDHR